MAFEVVKQIIETEKEGEELIKKASVKAVEIQKASNVEAENIMEKAKLDAEEYYNKIISRYELEGQAISTPILEEGNRIKHKIESTSPEVLDKAVNLILERIVMSHGNS